MNGFFISVLVVTLLVTLLIRKKYNIVTDLGLYRPINNTHKWGERILMILFFLVLIIFVFVFSFDEEIYLLTFMFLLILDSLRAFMEYKYEREEKEYIISVIWVISYCILFIGAIFFILKITTFAEVITDYESSNPESIQQIEIENNAWNEKARDLLDKQIEKRKITLEDKQIINRLLAELSILELREKQVNQGDLDNYYRMYFSDAPFTVITVYDTYISIDFEPYKVIGNNGVYEMLEKVELDWVYMEEKSE